MVSYRGKTIIFFVFTFIAASYVANKIYLIVVIRIERRETCEKLNFKKACILSNPKRAAFQALLREWIKLAQLNNITYVLSSGSLLGQYRNKDMIPWDIDVDMLVYDSFLSKLHEMTSPRNFKQGSDNEFHFVVQPEYHKPKIRRWNCNGQIVNGQPDHCSFIGPMARLIKGYDFVDIFGLKVVGDYAYEPYKKKYFKVDDLFPAKKCLFMGIETKCPKNGRKVLETFFHSIRQPCVCKDGRWSVESWWKF